MKINVPNWKLNNGLDIPAQGYGVFRIKDGKDVYNAVLEALNAGYRLIDTAYIYDNEAGVGRAIKDSDVPREEIFVTTKVWNSDQGYDKTIKAFHDSLERMQLDYIDLYLVHWPGEDKYIDTYKALEKLYDDGLAKSIGVCNFEIHHLENLMKNTKIVPAINQIEIHPLISQKETIKFCKDNDIQVEAWGPLMQGKQELDIKQIEDIGYKYGKTAAQVILRWHYENKVLALPKSETPSRIKENINIFDFSLTKDEVEIIDNLNQNKRLGPDPATFDRGF
ncbi:MAG: aldo/keto reductase [Clostridium sp.]|nr:aldo/keto reductase [Clostridium sp.]